MSASTTGMGKSKVLSPLLLHLGSQGVDEKGSDEGVQVPKTIPLLVLTAPLFNSGTGDVKKAVAVSYIATKFQKSVTYLYTSL
jgi:hypothetical protein